MADRKPTKYEESLIQAMLTADSQRDAYKKSLYKSDTMSNEAIDVEAHRILSRPHVALRLAELQDKLVERAAEKALVTAEDVLKSLIDIRNNCTQTLDLKAKNESGELEVIGKQMLDISGALKANELLGKHLKLFTDKVESTNVNLNHEMTDEEAEKILKQHGIDPEKV